MSSVAGTPPAIIEDGFTQEFAIPEVPGVSAAVSGVYRPMTTREIKRVLHANADSNPDVGDIHSCKAIAEHVVSWNLVNSKGEPLPITVDTVAKIQPPDLQAALLEVVAGWYNRPVTIAPAALRALVKNQNLTSDDKLAAILELLGPEKGVMSQRDADTKN